MCFRPPSAEAGEIICPHCHIVAEPNPDGTCPECGGKMRQDDAPAPSAPAAPSAVPPAPPSA